MSDLEKLLAAKDILSSTRRTMQLVDMAMENISKGRVALQGPVDVSTEHRTAWFGVVDDNDGDNGILAASTGAGFGAPFTGTIRVQEDAAFVCTQVLVAVNTSLLNVATGNTIEPFVEGIMRDAQPIMLALKDGNTGRNLTPGISTGPVDQDRGAVPLSVLTSVRVGGGPSFKHPLMSEFTIPRAGTVKVTLWNMGAAVAQNTPTPRVFVSLLGYKVFGG